MGNSLKHLGHDIAGAGEDVWKHTIGEIIPTTRRIISTHGGSVIYGPGAVVPHRIPPPAIPQPQPPNLKPFSTLAPQQSGIQNNFSTSNQYAARFGVSQSHF